jgi:hypothetical protein
MIHHLLPVLYAIFLTRGGHSLYNLPISMTYSRTEQWASISYARKHNQRAKIIRRRMKR